MNEKTHKILHLVVLFIVGLLVYSFVITPYLNTQFVNGIKYNPPSIAIEEKALIGEAVSVHDESEIVLHEVSKSTIKCECQ